AGIPASVRVRFAISPSTYDSVNFLEPMTTSAAEEELIRKAGTKEKIRKKSGSQKTRKRRNCFDFLDSGFPDSNLSCFPGFLIRFIHSDPALGVNELGHETVGWSFAQIGD